jgi:hypothetical protein
VHPLLAPVEALVVARGEKTQQAEDHQAEHRREDRAGAVPARAARLARAHPLAQGVEVAEGRGDQQQDAQRQVRANPEIVADASEDTHHEVEDREDDADGAERPEKRRGTHYTPRLSAIGRTPPPAW